MAVTIKSEREIELMRESCRLLAIVHKELEQMVRPGITTKDIDVAGENLIRKLGCIPNFKNYNGYPASICVPSMMKWFMEFLPQSASCRRATSSAWTQA